MGIFTTFFSTMQVLLILAGGVILIGSIFFELSGKHRLAVFLLFLAAVCTYSFAALLDPFLNIWDERFHALVAKNMMNHPLRPTLYDDPVVRMAYDNWTIANVWLHKQPLFLWQIALSFKLFGISEFTLRMPNIIMGSLLVLVTVRTGSLLTNPRIGYVAGIIMLSTVYVLEMVGGRQDMDHNDTAFLFYISLSIWTLTEYHFSGKTRWIILIGLFSGMAILCKWLVGLLVYFGWLLLRIQQKKFGIRDNLDLLKAFAITILIALPWQIFTFIAYPTEAVLAYDANVRHFLEPMDGQSGPWWFHFEKFNVFYGRLASFLIIPAFIILYRRVKNRQLFVAYTGMVIIVYVFFSLAVTKMGSFTIIVAMLMCIAFAALMVEMMDSLGKLIPRASIRSMLTALSLLVLVVIRFDAEGLQEKHTTWQDTNAYTRMLSHNKGIFVSLDLPQDAVLFNVRGRHYIEAMFYTGLPAYSFIPSEEQYLDLRSRSRRAAIFRPAAAEIPSYMASDSTLIVLEYELQGYD